MRFDRVIQRVTVLAHNCKIIILHRLIIKGTLEKSFSFAQNHFCRFVQKVSNLAKIVVGTLVWQKMLCQVTSYRKFFPKHGKKGKKIINFLLMWEARCAQFSDLHNKFKANFACKFRHKRKRRQSREWIDLSHLGAEWSTRFIAVLLH